MIRFLLNENVPLASVRLLRQAGWDIAAIIEDSPGLSDTEVMARAHREQRIIVTFDRDYGELLYRRRLPAPPGILYLRFAPLTPEEPGEYVLRLLTNPNITLSGHFTVADRHQLRQRPLEQLP
jgi:predicted nuclease of predicted toxin-antitoxin system